MHIAQGRIDLWHGTLADLELDYKQFKRLLSAPEMKRVQQYRLPERGKTFALIRGWMRTVLAQYIGCAPASLRLSYESGGKPVLTSEYMKDRNDRIEFNLSHSGDHFML